MDSPVQDPAGQPPADPEANAGGGLSALFRKRGAGETAAAETAAAETAAGETAAGETAANDADQETYLEVSDEDAYRNADTPEADFQDAYLEPGPEAEVPGFGASAGRPGAGAAGTSAPGAGAPGAGAPATRSPATRSPATSASSASGTSASGTSAPGRGSPDRGITRQPQGGRPTGGPPDRRQPAAPPVVSKPIINPRLRADPRTRVWLTRTIAAAVVYLGFMIWHGWRVGLSAAVVFVVADVIFRSKTMGTVPPAARVTAAQASTRRRLKVLQPAGYLALNACTIPGTRSVIDHVVVGPAGVFTIDSQHLDRRLSLLAKGGMLYHGPNSMEKRLDHAQQEANQAAALISAELGYKIKAKPAMVIYGPSIPWVIMTLKGIDVFEGSRVGTYFRRQTKATRDKHLDAGQIAVIYAAAVQALPPLR